MPVSYTHLGETITVEDALHAILLASANEVCTQLAIDIAAVSYTHLVLQL